MKMIMTAAYALFATSLCVLAGCAGAPAADVADAATAKVHCQVSEPATGSNMVRRSCKTEPAAAGATPEATVNALNADKPASSQTQ